MWKGKGEFYPIPNWDGPKNCHPQESSAKNFFFYIFYIRAFFNIS